MASASDQPGKSVKQKTEEHLKCPICLEAFKTPRSLTCLHTFCEGCITSCLLETVGKGSTLSVIKCPVCRNDTVPTDSSKPPSEWARDLPMNNAIVPMLKATESESRKHCDNCKQRHTDNWAHKFCIDCNEFQCSSCVDVHLSFKALNNHKLVELDDEGIPFCELNFGILAFCKDHTDKKIEVFCADHDICCCSVCAFVGHRTCKTVTEIRKLGEDLKQGGQIQQVVQEMDKLEGQVDELANTLEQNLSSIVEQAVLIPQEMKDIRTKVVLIFDQLVTDVTSECGQLKKQETTDLEDRITTLRSLDAAITASRSLLLALDKHGTNTQVFIALRLFQKQVKQYQKQRDDISRNLTTKELELCLSDIVSSLLKCTEALARVRYGKQVTAVTPITECTVKMYPTVDIKKREQFQKPGYAGAQHLPDGRLLVTDCINRLCCILDGTFKVIAQVQLSSTGYPRDLILMGPSEGVAVLEGSRDLQRVCVGTALTLTGTIHCTRTPRCLSRVSDTELAVGWEVGLGIIHLDGTEKFYLDKDTSGRQIKFSVHCHLLVDTVASHFYQSSYKDNMVFGMKMTGQPLFTYSVKQPRGLALDRDRNICVCNYTITDSSVHQLSPDGQCIRIIKLDLVNPYTICFNPAGTQMCVLQFEPTKAVKVEFVP